MTPARNALWSMAASIVEQLLGYVAFLSISHHLGAKGVGQYTFVFALAGLTLACSLAGIEPYLVREAARRPAGAASLGVNALAVKLSLALLAMAPALVYVHASAMAPAVRAAATLALAGVETIAWIRAAPEYRTSIDSPVAPPS